MATPAADRDGLDPPAYRAGALSDLVPTIGAALGVAEPGREPGPWTPRPTGKACLFLVDGMGRELLAEHAHHAPYLAGLLAEPGVGHTLTAGFPSTTSTSLASVGTGLPPGAHGMLGYRLMVPASGRLMNFLRWDQNVDPLVWQPRETMFERLSAAGIAVTHVSVPRFADSGLTRSVFRGARFTGVESVDEQIRRAMEALAGGRAQLRLPVLPRSGLHRAHLGGGLAALARGTGLRGRPGAAAGRAAAAGRDAVRHGGPRHGRRAGGPQDRHGPGLGAACGGRAARRRGQGPARVRDPGRGPRRAGDLGPSGSEGSPWCAAASRPWQRAGSARPPRSSRRWPRASAT